MDRTLVRIGALLSFLAVAIGAFARHTLEPKLSAHAIEVFDIGARYHALHAVGIILVGLLASFGDAKRLRIAGWLLVGGILVFSGSLYAFALSENKAFGALAPVGGLALMAGWVVVAFGFPSSKGNQ